MKDGQYKAEGKMLHKKSRTLSIKREMRRSQSMNPLEFGRRNEVKCNSLAQSITILATNTI